MTNNTYPAEEFALNHPRSTAEDRAWIEYRRRKYDFSPENQDPILVWEHKVCLEEP